MSLGYGIFKLAELLGKGAVALDQVISDNLFAKKEASFKTEPSSFSHEQLKDFREWCNIRMKENYENGNDLEVARCQLLIYQIDDALRELNQRSA